MKSRLILALASLALVAACGDDSGTTMGGDGGGGTADGATMNCAANGGADCFVLPTAAMTKDDGTPANFACSPETIMTRDTEMQVMGLIQDFQTGNEVPNATIKAFYTSNITGTPDAMATADGTGAYTITLPAGAKNRMNWLMERASGALPTYAINVPLDIATSPVTGYNRESISTTTANALPAFIGHARTPGLGVVAGVAEDCDGDSVQHAVGTIASAASDGNAANIAFVPGAEVYYFIEGLPVRRGQQDATNTDGIFVALEIPVAATSYLQVWGFTSEADVAMGAAGLTLVAELPTAVIGDAVLAIGMNPNKGPQ